MRLLTITIAIALALSGCKKEPQSAIVEKVKLDGAGDVEQASLASITEWVRGKGVTYADDLWKDCEPIKKSAPATWSDSTEGRVCAAAYSVRINTFRPAPEGGRPKF
jgi:hypothetical protein